MTLLICKHECLWQMCFWQIYVIKEDLTDHEDASNLTAIKIKKCTKKLGQDTIKYAIGTESIENAVKTRVIFWGFLCIACWDCRWQTVLQLRSLTL